MTNIYLIRHGFTPANNANYNRQRGIREIAEDSDMPLEREYGVKQAREVGEFLNSLICGKTLVFVSPYRRTLETFKYACEVMNGDLEVSVDERIREIDSGVHYARVASDVFRDFPETREFFDSRDTYLADVVPFYGGESQKDVRDRVASFAYDVQMISESEYYDNILIFTHGVAMKWIYYWLSEGKKLKFGIKNCEVIKASGDDIGKSLFIPVAYVPKGFVIDIPRYIDLVNNELEKDDVKSLRKVLTKKGVNNLGKCPEKK